VFGYKTDPNITVISSVSLNEIKLSTDACFIYITDPKRPNTSKV